MTNLDAGGGRPGLERKPLSLIAEDEASLMTRRRYNIEKEGYRAVEAYDGEEALLVAAEDTPDLVVLDWMLPKVSGIEVCRRLRGRAETKNVPIIMLTARGEEADRVRGLDTGADDYITKPFSMKEMLARVRAILRRRDRHAEEPGVYMDELIHLDPEGHILRVKDKEVSLTRKEFDLLAALVRNRGRVLSRETLLQKVWGYDYFGETRTVDVHIRRLRKKLGQAAAEGIETVVGVGYRFRAAD